MKIKLFVEKDDKEYAHSAAVVCWKYSCAITLTTVSDKKRLSH